MAGIADAFVPGSADGGDSANSASADDADPPTTGDNTEAPPQAQTDSATRGPSDASAPASSTPSPSGQSAAESNDAATSTPSSSPMAEADDSASTEPTACDPANGHPLRGRYAVRTVSYARHKATYGNSSIDTISKGVLLSVANISETGAITEELCALEVLPRESLYGWMGPSVLSSVEPSRAQLVARDGVFVRTASDDQAVLGWEPYLSTEPCNGREAGRECICSRDEVPKSADDCRVFDPDGDGAPGLTLSADVQRRTGPDAAAPVFRAQVIGVKATEWRLSPPNGDRVRGSVAGGLALWPLSLQGSVGSQLIGLRSASCPVELGNVQLVRSQLSCEELFAARATNLETLGVFEVASDSTLPSPSSCRDPDCDIDSDADGAMNCEDECDTDPEKRSAGPCGCGSSDRDSDADGTADCNDACPVDPAKIEPGRCGCNEEACTAMAGSYAARSTVFLSLDEGASQVRTWRVSSYALVTVARDESGELTLAEQPCWSWSEPDPSDGGPNVYSWTSPSVTSTPIVRPMTRTADGSWVASSGTRHVGFAPSDCTTASPGSEWRTGWGETCRCVRGESELPPYDRDGEAYDCRLRDSDRDGYPGTSIFVHTSAPQDASYVPSPGEGARVMLAATTSDQWTLSPTSDRRHRGTIDTSYVANIVGCTGAGCPYLPVQLPTFEACAGGENDLQLVPVDAGLRSCSELLSQRESLFADTPPSGWPPADVCR